MRAMVLLDNLAAHKVPRGGELIAAAGGEILYLATYLPDVNPIEQAVAKLKHLLHAAKKELPRTFGRRTATFSTSSNQPSAQTVLPMPDTDPYDLQTL